MNYIAQIEAHAAAQGLTPIGLFKACGIHQTTWNRWKRGETQPQIRVLELLMAYGKGETRVEKRWNDAVEQRLESEK